MKGKRTITGIVIAVAIAIIYFLVDPNQEKPKITTNVSDEIITVEKRDFRLPDSITTQIIKRPFFTLSYNELHEQADWVAYTLYPNNEDSTVVRKNRFKSDPLVVSESASLKDYKGSGYDRGHLAPSKALSFSQEANDASFFMSNMSPQELNFNRGIWKKIEAAVYKWSQKSDSLYVVTGPVLNTVIDTIGENKVSVPSAYYKTVLRFKDARMSGIGFLIENKKSSQPIESFFSSIDSIEKVTGFNFYALLDTIKQSRLEANKLLDQFID
ncbi:MAG: DNA/RNA non-specific endonuclease [Flavobacteriaceae bacterium]